MQKTAPGSHESTTSLSLAQMPVRSGSARVVPALLAHRNLIGPGTVASLTYGEPRRNELVEDPSGLIATGAFGSSATGLAIASAGAAGGALSLAGGLFLMGPLMLPWAYEKATEAADRQTIADTVVQFGFPAKLEERIRLQMTRAGEAAAQNEQNEPNARDVELQVTSYGLAFKDTNRVACLTFHGTLTARDGETIVYEDPIIWTPSRRSEDFSPVSCATIDEMAQSDGEFVRRILDEAVIVISASAVRRLRGKGQ